MARYLFFAGRPHYEVHLRFFHRELGGEMVLEPYRADDPDVPAALLEHDGADAVWFFPTVYPHLHPLLRGRQILTKHGLSFAHFMTERRVRSVNEHLTMVLQPGRTQERHHEAAGVDARKIRPFAYPLVFLIPELPVRPNAVLYSTTPVRHWNHYSNLVRIVERNDASLEGFLAIHPGTPATWDARLRAAADRGNVRVVDGQAELMEAYAVCACNVSGGSSSVGTPFWFLGKPVVFLRGRRWMFWKGLGWARVKREIADPLFDRILDESTRLDSWRDFRPALVRDARVAPSAKEVFYPANFDLDETRALLRRYVAEAEAA